MQRSQPQQQHHRQSLGLDRTTFTKERTMYRMPEMTPTGRNLLEEVSLPQGVSCAEWVAINLVDFFEGIKGLWEHAGIRQVRDRYSLSGQGFPTGVEYLWPTGEEPQGKLLSAPMYIDKVLEWIRDNLDEFPNLKESGQDPSSQLNTKRFAGLCGRIIRRLFRVFAILLSSFRLAMIESQTLPHAKRTFKHFFFFCTEFGLLDDREQEPFQSLVDPVRKQYHEQKKHKAFSAGIAPKAVPTMPGDSPIARAG